jgi:hypothetical protein
MTPRLIEAADDMEAVGSTAGRIAAAFARAGTQAFITNTTSRMMLVQSGLHSLPVTVDDGGYGRSYVASPHSAYVLYAREEIDIVGLVKGRRLATTALGVLDALLCAARINRAVHIDNWLLSTNLHGDWDGAGLTDIRRLLAERFPTHFLILRSLDAWSCPRLLQAAREDGWVLLPARQVWVVDDLAREWRPRNNFANDRRALAKSGLTIEDAGPFDAADRVRVAELYEMLYIQKYSALNPVFTPDFIALTQTTGLLHYRVARDQAGRIMAVAGMLARGQVMTPPVVGYDITRPRADALYRVASFLFSEWAMARGLRLHGSAGAADFKRRRGARGVIEYMAVHARHLDIGRRAAVRLLARQLERLVVPMMQKEGW